MRTVVARFDRSDALAVHAPASLPWPHANGLMVERLVSNLVDNALKHGKAPIHVSLQEHAQQIWLKVSDAGPGIAPAHVESLQQAFTRGTSNRSVPGTGLGLSIVRHIANRLGGQVIFTGQPGAHTVRVTLERRQG
nr:sensor histidine kinase [uncultured Albidiferax sp.]